MRGETTFVVGDRPVRFANAHTDRLAIDHPDAQHRQVSAVNNPRVHRRGNKILIHKFAFRYVDKVVIVLITHKDIVIGSIDLNAIAFATKYRFTHPVLQTASHSYMRF